ncbi:MAG: hypothetical protein V3T86_03920, partial [Planctomycetota bacterium]
GVPKLRTYAADLATTEATELSAFATERRRSWARLLRKVLEVDPLLCPDCRVEMQIVSVITETVVVDSIL